MLGCIHSVTTPGCPRCDERRKNWLVIRGTLFLWIETGHGGYAIQDERFIKGIYPNEQWSYDGLYVLKEGDLITAYNTDGSVYWEGHVHLNNMGRPKLAKTWWEKFRNIFRAEPLPTNTQWGQMFMKEKKGRLYRCLNTSASS